MNRSYYRSSYPRRGWTAPYNGGWIGRRPTAFRLTGTKRTTRDSIKKVQRDVKFLKRVIEIKQVDVPLNVSHIPAFVGGNDQVLVINQTLVGPGMWQRIGNRINMKDLEICANIQYTSTRNQETNQCLANEYRICIIYDKLASNLSGSGVPATKPNFNQIFMERDKSGATNCHWLTPKSPDVGDRYVILYDKKRVTNQTYENTLNDPSQDPGTPAKVVINYLEQIKINLRGRPTVYNAAQEITEGALYFVAVARHMQDNLTSFDNLNYLTVGINSCRLRYYDS